MNKCVPSGLAFILLGSVCLLSAACGGQEQPPPAEPSGYQPPTAEPGTDQGIGNMKSDVESTEPTDNVAAGMETAPGDAAEGTAVDQGTTGAMGTGGNGGTGNGGSGETTSPGTGAGR